MICLIILNNESVTLLAVIILGLNTLNFNKLHLSGTEFREKNHFNCSLLMFFPLLCRPFKDRFFRLSTRPSIRPSVVRHENLTLAITLQFLNISSPNFQIILLMITRTHCC